LLEEAYRLIPLIPATVDQLDRVQTIADSWRQLGEKDQSKFVLRFIFERISELQSVGFDERLAAITQLAYKIAPDFADEVVSRFDTRQPNPFLSTSNIALEIEKLVGNPSRINDVHNYSYAQGIILSASAKQLLQDFVSGRSTVFSLQVLEDWLKVSQIHSSEVSLNVSEWVIESLYHKYQSVSSKEIVETLIDVANLVHQLANWVSPELRAGIPESIQDSFSGLGTKFAVFQAGETERAQHWLEQWLITNVDGYLKICDPYFGIEQIEYFRNIPIDCKIIVITTDKKLDTTRGVEVLKAELELYWRKLSSQAMPSTQFIVVPEEFEGRFHDRALISRKAGIDIGQSLNGIGKSRGKLTLLTEEEAKELEKTYIDDMLNQATWFMQHGVAPTIFSAGGSL
ncbi:MAG TPA: hypothetical protein VFT66_14175, partial [Roseiflexaceae bacterium]|nr:hypothetical protein [Roseiflexaceae bacterium]